jgi:hypothetical protein
MGGSDNHAKQNSYYLTAVHYHRRSWLPLFYFLLDAAVTNSYILYKIGVQDKKKLSHVEFQEEITRNLLRGPGAILRQRPARHFKASSNPYTKTVRKGTDQGHAWGKLDSYRRCQVCNPPKRFRNCLSTPPTTQKALDRQATGQCTPVPNVISQSVTIRTVGHGICPIHSRIATNWHLVLTSFPIWVSRLSNKVSNRGFLLAHSSFRFAWHCGRWPIIIFVILSRSGG